MNTGFVEVGMATSVGRFGKDILSTGGSKDCRRPSSAPGLMGLDVIEGKMPSRRSETIPGSNPLDLVGDVDTVEISVSCRDNNVPEGNCKPDRSLLTRPSFKSSLMTLKRGSRGTDVGRVSKCPLARSETKPFTRSPIVEPLDALVIGLTAVISSPIPSSERSPGKSSCEDGLRAARPEDVGITPSSSPGIKGDARLSIKLTFGTLDSVPVGIAFIKLDNIPISERITEGMSFIPGSFM